MARLARFTPLAALLLVLAVGGLRTTPANSQDPPRPPDAGEGGAEQIPEEPLPPPSAPPVEPEPAPASEPPLLPVSFDHSPVGQSPPGQGSGYLDRTLWVPDMCWPLQEAGFANSQVYGPGGGMGPAGHPSQCDSLNYSLPWRDNFCETRSRANPLCAGGGGHQGQDIRPASCHKNLHWAVAAEAGKITDIGTYTVTLTATAPPHLTYRYLHMQMATLAVQEGSVVAAGQKLGKVANDFGSTPTTIHLHFEIRAGVDGVTTDGRPVAMHTFLPPYMSLATAYQRKLDGRACGLETVSAPAPEKS